jgi:hypothetical protein
MAHMATQKRVTDVRPMMNNERIIGILIYAVMRDTLTSEIVELARSVPKEYYDSLGDDWDMVGYFIHANLTVPLEERSLQYVQDRLYSEIEGMAWRAVNPDHEGWRLEEEDDD